MNDATQKIAKEAAKETVKHFNKLPFDYDRMRFQLWLEGKFKSAIKKATEETNAANCSLLALAAIVKGHPDTPESLKAIASKELLDHTRGAYLINELRTLRAAHASEPWTVENIEDVWIVRIGTLRIVTSKANAIALRDAHNATIQPAHASEQSEIAREIGIIREVLKTLIVWIAQSAVGVISADNAKQLIDKLETNRI